MKVDILFPAAENKPFDLRFNLVLLVLRNEAETYWMTLFLVKLMQSTLIPMAAEILALIQKQIIIVVIFVPVIRSVYPL